MPRIARAAAAGRSRRPLCAPGIVTSGQSKSSAVTLVPDWDSVRASKTVAAVLLGELSIGTPREAGTRVAAELLDCPLVMVPGAHNGLRDRPGAAAQTVLGILGL